MGARSRSLEPGAGGAGEAAADVPGARLAANQIRRMRRIVDAAVELAEQGGFEAVRLRDVAERSDVALGTLYKYFRSKEAILLFALDEEIARLETATRDRPVSGPSPGARVAEFFRRATRALLRRPQFAHAIVRAMATGDPDTALKIASVQLRVSRLIAACLRGEPPDLAAPLDCSSGDARERAIASTLTNVWFSSLVGWSAGLHPERMVGEQVRVAADLILGGA
jgi:AcrR family transcriptional regulator